jgi:hypothetical protein
MHRPLRFALLLVGALPAATWADGPAPAVAPAPAPKSAPMAPSDRPVSQDIAAALAATIPKFQPAPPLPAADAPVDADVVRMPAYLVREPKLPKPSDVLTQKGVAGIAMDRYLGPADGFDRNILNHFTLSHLWQQIPVLGQVPFVPFGSISNEARAMELYNQDKRLSEKAELLDEASLWKKTGDAEGGAKLKSEVDDTFK